MDPDTRTDVRSSILRVGAGVALARGHFGRRMTLEDEQTLLLVEQLLQTAPETLSDNPLNSPATI